MKTMAKGKKSEKAGLMDDTGHGKEKFPKITREEMLDKAKTPDKYPEVDTFVRLTDLILDQKTIKKDREGDGQEITKHTAVLKGEYAKGTPEEVIVTVRYKTQKKENLKNFLRGRMTPDDEYNVGVK
jgi:hypothetical protein